MSGLFYRRNPKSIFSSKSMDIPSEQVRNNNFQQTQENLYFGQALLIIQKMCLSTRCTLTVMKIAMNLFD